MNYFWSLVAATGTLVAATSFFEDAYAQSRPNMPRCQPIELAGICVARNAQGVESVYDLENGRLLRGPGVDSETFQGNAATRIGRAPLGQSATPPPARGDYQVRRLDDLLDERGIDRNQVETGQPTDLPQVVEPLTDAPAQTQTAAIVKPENPVFNSNVELADLQVLLDRLGVSPGVIDGKKGSNVAKAIRAYIEETGRDLSTLTNEQLQAELSATGGDAFINYTITQSDVDGPYAVSIPVDYGEKALLPAMSFTSASEALAERFHMDENYLKTLNSGVNFVAGANIRVANVGVPLKGKVARIEADKGATQVRAYDANGKLVAAYPATIGSAATPSPSGIVTVERIAVNPVYTYNPKINFTQGENKSILTIPPGPNGPVGTVWIALSKPTYGIHGTPDPSRIGKTNSHGCIRLTNWDARELVGMVSKGVTVEFLE